MRLHKWLEGRSEMLRYKQLIDAYALNHEAVVERRMQFRAATNNLRLSLLGYLGIGDKNSDIVSLTAADGSDLFVPLARLELDDALVFRLVVALGGEQGLPETTMACEIELESQKGNLVLSIAPLSIVQNVVGPDSYHSVSEAIFESMLGALGKF